MRLEQRRTLAFWVWSGERLAKRSAYCWRMVNGSTESAGGRAGLAGGGGFSTVEHLEEERPAALLRDAAAVEVVVAFMG